MPALVLPPVSQMGMKVGSGSHCATCALGPAAGGTGGQKVGTQSGATAGCGCSRAGWLLLNCSQRRGPLASGGLVAAAQEAQPAAAGGGAGTGAGGADTTGTAGGAARAGGWAACGQAGADAAGSAENADGAGGVCGDSGIGAAAGAVDGGAPRVLPPPLQLSIRSSSSDGVAEGWEAEVSAACVWSGSQLVVAGLGRRAEGVPALCWQHASPLLAPLLPRKASTALRRTS